MKATTTTNQRIGFSLIEVLAVLGILAILVAGATPPIINAIKANRLTTAADLLVGKLNEAQTLAVTFSSDVEIRFYDADNSSHELAATRTDGVQVFHLADPSDAKVELPSDGFVAAGLPEKLPEGIAINRTETLSNIWNLRSGNRDRSEETPYAAIRFFPDGTTNLQETGIWHLTLVEDRLKQSENLPPNFATIQIDPVTGWLEVYRPN